MTTSLTTATGPAQMTDDIRGPARPSNATAGLVAWADRGSAWQMRCPDRRSKGLPDVRAWRTTEAGGWEINLEEL
jgi:hypothetical protein